MASYQALGTGPVTFLDGNQSQKSIPLSAIYFDGSSPNATLWPEWTTTPANQGLITALLTQLVQQGLLVPGPTPVSQPALTITAAEPGAPGNSIQVKFSSPNTSVNPPTITAEVSAIETYPGLTLATLEAALGNSAATATGVIFLSGGPTAVMPVAQSNPITAGGTLNIVDATSTTVFTVEAVDQVPLANDTGIQLAVSAVTATAFTLTASWDSGPKVVTMAELTNPAQNPFQTLVSFTAPTNGPLPAAGTLVLLGGAPATSSPPAAASVVALSA